MVMVGHRRPEVLVRSIDWVDEQVAATEPEAQRFGPRLPLGTRFPDDPIYELLRDR